MNEIFKKKTYQIVLVFYEKDNFENNDKMSDIPVKILKTKSKKRIIINYKKIVEYLSVFRIDLRKDPLYKITKDS